MSEQFLSVSPVPASAAEVIERQRRKLSFWRTLAFMAIMFAITFAILFFHAVAVLHN